jgi:hypothetical protein
MTTLTYYMLDRSLVWELVEKHDIGPVAVVLLFALVTGVQEPKVGRWTGYMADLTVRLVGVNKRTIHEALERLVALGLIAVERPFARNGKAPASILVLCFGALVRAPAGDEWGVTPVLECSTALQTPSWSALQHSWECSTALQTRENPDKTTTDSLEAVAVVGGTPTAVPPADHEISDDGMRAGWQAVARYRARGREVRDEWALARYVGHVHDQNPPKAKTTSQPSPKALRQSEGLESWEVRHADSYGDVLIQCVECKRWGWEPDDHPLHSATCSHTPLHPCPNGVAGCDRTNQVGTTCSKCMDALSR